jgi:hypothetical protein
VPEKSFKTAVSPEAKSITPEKDNDVIMSEADEGGTASGTAGGNESGAKADAALPSKSEAVAAGEAGEKSGDETDAVEESNQGGEGSSDAMQIDSAGEVDKHSLEKPPNGDESAMTSIKQNSEEKEAASSAATDPFADPSLPMLKGTLSYSEQGDTRRHAIRGNWNYEQGLDTTPQRFELIRTIPPEEDLKDLPKDGEFSGSFRLQYQVRTSKGNLKWKSKVVSENGVKITFQKQEGEPDTYAVKGLGTNCYGTFELFGTARKSEHDDEPTYNVQLRKKYITLAPAPVEETLKDKKRKFSGIDSEEGEKELPPPSESYPSGVICLRGKLTKRTAENIAIGGSDIVHHISGLWSTGLDLILQDLDNTKGLCNKFEYEHKSSGAGSDMFPLSGRYTGWFYVNTEVGKTKVPEKDIMLKFRENNKGYHNVEGKGANGYGKYTITGTLTEDGIITLFRHFQAPKQKKTSHIKISTTPAPGPLNGSADKKVVKPAEPPLLSFDDVEIPSGSEPVAMVTPPEQYSAVSRGILRVNDDGAHTCSGNWAITNEHFQNGQTSKYHFGIEAHHAAEDAKIMIDRMNASGANEDDDRQINGKVGDGVSPVSLANTTFPIDSAQYKGSFKMRRGTTKFQTVYDKQIVLKFVKNSQGSYNVYGKGVNEFGTFDLVGTLILQGKTNGHIQLYRMYPPVPVSELEPTPPPVPVVRQTGKVFPGSLTEKVSKDNGPVPAMKPPEKFPSSQSTLQRRESSRQVKVPSRLEDDDPEAQRERLMEKCRQILKEVKDKDLGRFFAAPVDPVALGIPTYPDIITNPMDLGTIQTKMDANEIASPEEFARLVRLVFENAITFNTLPDNVVHIAARNLLIFFNQKFRSIDRVLDATKKSKKLTKAELKEIRRQEKEAKKKAKEESNKRKSSDVSGSEPKRRRVEDFVAVNKATLDAIAQAVPQDPEASVSRTEFNLLLQMVQQMQEHIVSVHKLLSSNNRTHTVPSSPSKAGTSALAKVGTPEKAKSSAPKPAKHKKKEKVEKPKVEAEPSPQPSPKESPEHVPVEEDRALSFEEQEALSEAINRLPERLLPGAMQIIREADFVNDDDDEIDLDIDQLDTKTQRKLQRFVMENVKPKRKKHTKKPKSGAAAPAPAPAAPAPAPIPSPEPEKPKPKPGAKSFFSMGQDDSDSDSDADEPKQEPPEEKKAPAKNHDPFADDDEDDDEDDEDDLKVDDIATNWVANPSEDAAKEDDTGKDSDDEDDLWGAAKKEAEASKALEADRAKREEKMKAEAEIAAQKRMEEAAALGEQVRAKREEEEAAEARLREEQEREAEEARKAAREKALKEVNEVQNTIDLDAQRKLMEQYEQEFNDNYSAGASPSSDFGF